MHGADGLNPYVITDDDGRVADLGEHLADHAKPGLSFAGHIDKQRIDLRHLADRQGFDASAAFLISRAQQGRLHHFLMLGIAARFAGSLLII